MYKETKQNSCKCLQLKSSHYLFNRILLCDFIAILNFFMARRAIPIIPYNCFPMGSNYIYMYIYICLCHLHEYALYTYM